MSKKDIFKILPQSILENDSLDNILKAFLVAQQHILLNPTNFDEQLKDEKPIKINVNLKPIGE